MDTDSFNFECMLHSNQLKWNNYSKKYLSSKEEEGEKKPLKSKADWIQGNKIIEALKLHMYTRNASLISATDRIYNFFIRMNSHYTLVISYMINRDHVHFSGL